MSNEKERVDGYMSTINRLEPDISMIDASAFYASAAISLKRIADAMDMVVVSIIKDHKEKEADYKSWMERKGFGDLLK